MTREPDDLLTLDQVAAELAVSYETARTLTTSGRLAFVDVGNGTDRKLRRVRRVTLDAFKRAERREQADEQFAAARAQVRPVTRGQAAYY